MNKIDCYILTIPGREHFLEQCLSSLKPAESIFNIHIYLNDDLNIPSAVSYVIKNRIKSPIFTYISDDDLYVDAGAAEQCLRKLENIEYVGASTTANMIDENGALMKRGYNPEPYSKKLHHEHPTHVHEMIFLRTNIVKEYLDPTFESLNVLHYWYLTMSVVQHGKWFKSARIGHQWRMHPGNVHKTLTHHRNIVPPLVKKVDMTK
jgi:hypothetical protein